MGHNRQNGNVTKLSSKTVTTSFEFIIDKFAIHIFVRLFTFIDFNIKNSCFGNVCISSKLHVYQLSIYAIYDFLLILNIGFIFME